MKKEIKPIKSALSDWWAVIEELKGGEE